MVALELVAQLEGHVGKVWSVDWSPVTKTLASAGADKIIRLWHREGDRWVCATSLDGGNTRTIRQVKWSPCGNKLATASFDSTTCSWEKGEEGGEL